MKTIPIIIVFITSFFITELFAQEDKIPVPSISGRGCRTCEYLREQAERMQQGKKPLVNPKLMPADYWDQKSSAKPFDAYGWPTHYYPILSNRTDSDNNGLRECRVKIDFDPFWQEGYYSYKEVEALKGDVRKCITIYNRSLQYVGLEFKEVDDESYHILIETTDDPELKDNAGWATSFGAWSFDKSILQLRRNYEHFGAYQYLLEKGASNALYKRPPGNPYAFVYSLDNFWTMRNGKNFFREPISEVVMHEMGHLVGIMHPFLALNNTQTGKADSYLIDWLSWPVIGQQPPTQKSYTLGGEDFSRAGWSRGFMNTFMTYDSQSNVLYPDLPPPIKAFLAHYYGKSKVATAQTLLDIARQEHKTYSILEQGNIIQEEEPNDTQFYANKLSIGIPVLGALSSTDSSSTSQEETFKDTVDWYVFSVDAQNIGRKITMELSIGSAYYKNYYKILPDGSEVDGTVQLKVVRPSKTPLLSTAAEFPSFSIIANEIGNYFVSVNQPQNPTRLVSKDYLLTVKFTDALPEKLPTPSKTPSPIPIKTPTPTKTGIPTRPQTPTWKPTPTWTPTPVCTPTIAFTPVPSNTPETLLQYEFSKSTLEENGWMEIPGGFIPNTPNGSIIACDFTANQIPSSLDHKGLAITVKPKETGFIYANNPVNTDGMPVLLRMTIRSSSPAVSIALFALRGDQGTITTLDGSLAANNPFSAISFVESERRLFLVYQPDKGKEIIPAIQITATGQNEIATVWIDKLEIVKLDPAIFGNATNNDIITPTPKPVVPTGTPFVPSTPTSFPGQGKQITVILNLPSDAKPLEMVLIQPGTFMMGSPESEKDRGSDEGPQHQVTITKPFYMGKYEVTQAQWQSVMGSNPSDFKGSNHPVEKVSLDDCQRFIEKLNQKSQGTFRLPTEAEWEYSCRAGTTARFYWGDDLNNTQISEFAWYGDNNSLYGTKEVGLKKPNAFGLYDMSGNVLEWCNDWYGTYTSNAQNDPTSQNLGSSRLYRGGGWNGDPKDCRSAARGHNTPNGFYKFTLGFRLVRLYEGVNPTPSPTPTITPSNTPKPTPTTVPTVLNVTALKTITVYLPGLPENAKKLEMVLIPAGKFIMGSTDIGPQHQVTISRPFYLGKYEITQGQWQTVMNNNPSYLNEHYPMGSVSWNDCQLFIQKLNKMGQGTFRLPTEAEWEYACRAGTSTRFYWGDDLSYTQIGEYAWYKRFDTAPVGLKKPNNWGLYDMSGNVWEWCQDLYGLYSSGSQIDPTGRNSGINRVFRGGSYEGDAKNCSSANRNNYSPVNSATSLGFRLERSYP